MLGNTDKPIERQKDDTFGIERYVNGLSTFILNSDTPMTISIQGDWGSGKTSMMNMIQEKISRDTYTIWFNTWQFSQFELQNELTLSMLYYLLSQLDYDSEGLKKIVTALGGAMRLATGFAAEKVLGGAAAGEILSNMNSASRDYPTEIRKLKSKFQELINDKLAKTKKDRVVIFIDDLDRLQPQKAVELLEVLKVFLDCENCVYVLAVDYEIVTQGIKEKFGDQVDAKKGRSFFDKIIQLPFKVPTAQYNIARYVGSMLLKMGMQTDNVDDFVRLINLSIGCNPRSIKRLFNTYLLLDIMLRDKLQAQGDAQTHLLLFAIICIQMEYEELYRYILSSEDTLDEEFFREFEGDIFNNGDLKDALGTEDEVKLARIANFMKYLNTLLEIGKERVSEQRLEKLKSILSFSTVTSVNTQEGTEEKSEFDWKYRYQNKNIAKAVNQAVLEKTGANFSVWQPRKNASEHRISDTWGTSTAEFAGVNYAVGYHLKTNYAIGITEVAISIYRCKPTALAEFDRLFDINPLTMNCSHTDGEYRYTSVYKFSESATEKAIGDIANIVEKALAEIAAFLDGKG